MLERKNIQDKTYVLGQYFTPPEICARLVAGINFADGFIVEPSFGTGNFLASLQSLPNDKIGIELDEEIFSDRFADDKTTLLNQNFYDFTLRTGKKLFFIGNPPYRTPAYSLTTHKKFIADLTKKFSVGGIREEAVFFILHTLDLIRGNGGSGEIHYIVPTSLLRNNSKFYTRFKQFLKQQCRFLKITSIRGADFMSVTQDLVFLSLDVRPTPAIRGETEQELVDVDGAAIRLDEYLCLEEGDSIPFQKIFKKTYLGSVPCESLLMSVKGESREDFKNRLSRIISDKNISIEKLYQSLQADGNFHLRIFKEPEGSPAVQDKLKKILSYVRNIQEKDGILEEFSNIANFKEINVRKGIRYYFRCEKLKKGKNFVYELNPNPCKSFYFTGNPSHSSTDYFGFCEYDCNRNVSPGANRTVPIEGIEQNLTDYFVSWWRANTDEPLSEVTNYMMHVAKTDWYRDMKKKNKRFYFAIPEKFIPREERTTTPSLNLPVKSSLPRAH